MATIQSIKAKIQGLIDKSNEATGGSDTDLTTAINTLIKGQKGTSYSRKIIDRTIEEYTNDVVTTIGASSFYYCKSLTDVYFPNALTIDSNAFSSCTALQKADLPKVTTINSNAFYNCTLLEVLILRNVEKVCVLSASSALSNSKIASRTGHIYVPKTLLNSYKTATNWSTYANQFRAIEDYPNICTRDDTTSEYINSVDKGDFNVVTSVIDKTITEYVDNVLLSTGNSAFAHCKSLKKVDLPELVEAGESTFDGCSNLEEVNLPNLSILGSGSFQDCTALKKVDLFKVTSIESYTFFRDTALEAVILRVTENICELKKTNAFSSSKIASGTGYIYVPSALINSYKTATNWSTYANQFRAIEDYPNICG